MKDCDAPPLSLWLVFILSDKPLWWLYEGYKQRSTRNMVERQSEWAAEEKKNMYVWTCYLLKYWNISLHNASIQARNITHKCVCSFHINKPYELLLSIQFIW